jgi:hypothetical protein
MATRRKKGKARARVARRILRIHYLRTRGGRVRYQIGAGTSSHSYASRQGARRAARRAHPRTRLVWSAA